MDYKEKIIALLNDKELSQEQKEKLEYIFPELKESKDETIRKEIIEFVDINTLSVDERHDRWIAWLEKQGQTFTKKDVDDAYLKGIIDAKNELEKQGEQKSVLDFKASNRYVSKVDGKIHDMTYNPADKVEPKFHEGEWIVWKNKCYKVNYNGCGYELIDQNGLSTSLEYGTVDENAHLWDITKDANNGDVLISTWKGCPYIYIFKEVDNNIIISHIFYYPELDAIDMGVINMDNTPTVPATKEQRDTLEKAMTDAGYTFDFEKKELKKIEQNPTWSDEDEKMLNTIIADFKGFKHDNTSTLESHFTECIDWLKSLKDRIGG